MRISIALFLILSIMQTAHADIAFNPDNYSTYCRAQNTETECTKLSYCEWDESSAVSCTYKTLCDSNSESVFCYSGTYYDKNRNQCESCPAGYVNSPHYFYFGTNTDTNCYPHDECQKCTRNTYAKTGASSCSDCQPGYVANAEHTGCTECDPGTVPTPPTSDEDGDFTCKKCPPSQIAYSNNRSCESCGAFGTPNDAQTKCVCWVSINGYKELCIPDTNDYSIEYAILFNNNPAISSDKTDVVEVKYKLPYKGSPTYKTSVKSFLDPEDYGYDDEVQIYTYDNTDQKPIEEPTADNNDYLFIGWRDENNPNINIIIEDKLTAEDADEILNPSKMTEADKVQFLDEDGDPWELYGKELTAIWEKCEIKYEYDGSYSLDPTACKCGEKCDVSPELPKNAPAGRKFLGWFCKDDANCIDSCGKNGDSQVSAIESCEITDGAPTLTAVFDDCPKGYYCPQDAKEPTPCPAGTTSELNSETINDCYIMGGKSRICNQDGSKCFTIPAGNYKIKKQ